MTKKDYKQFADMIVDLKVRESKGLKNDVDIVETLLTTILVNDNPRFDGIKWDEYITKELARELASKE